LDFVQRLREHPARNRLRAILRRWIADDGADMSIIDRQRIAAVRLLESLGYRFESVEWVAPAAGATQGAPLAEADAMHALLVARADKLDCSAEDEQELASIARAVLAYEARRWPNGRDSDEIETT
jgi:hypothetical protein